VNIYDPIEINIPISITLKGNMITKNKDDLAKEIITALEFIKINEIEYRMLYNRHTLTINGDEANYNIFVTIIL